MSAPTSVPAASFLGAYARQGAYTDCYATAVPGTVTMAEFVYAFYTTRLFKLERWLLAKALRLPSTDAQAQQLAQASTGRFAAWRVEQRAADELLLDAGQTRSWLGVRPQTRPQAGPRARPTAAPQPATTALLFGSAVLPLRPGGRFGPAFHLLLGFHRLYSRLLLSAAARRVVDLRRARGAG